MPSTVLNSNVDLTNLSASNLTSGTLPDARFPATLPAISGANLTNIPVSSDYVRLSNGSMSSSNTLTFDNLDTSTYKTFRIILSDVVCLANHTQLRGRFRYDNSGTQATRIDSNYWIQTQGHRVGPAGSGSTGVIDYSANNIFTLNEYLTQYDRPSTQTFDIHLYDIANTNGHKSIQVSVSGGQDTTGTDYYFYMHGNGYYRNTGANNGFTIYTANGDNFSGNYQIYGIK